MSRAEEIAAGLTRGELRALLAANEAGEVPIYYPERDARGHRARIMIRTLVNMEHEGLILLWPPRLTPLGEEVRRHLQQQERGE